jgi:hypothetical protein
MDALLGAQKPNPQYSRHWPSMVRVFVLLVGIWALASFIRTAGGDEKQWSRRIGGQGKKESQAMVAGDFEGSKGGILWETPTAGAKSAA